MHSYHTIKSVFAAPRTIEKELHVVRELITPLKSGEIESMIKSREAELEALKEEPAARKVVKDEERGEREGINSLVEIPTNEDKEEAVGRMRKRVKERLAQVKSEMRNGKKVKVEGKGVVDICT